MLISRDDFYNNLKNNKYTCLIPRFGAYMIEYIDFNKDLESQTSYDAVYINQKEREYFSDFFSKNKILDDLERLKNEMLEYDDNHRVLCILATKNDDDLFYSGTEKKEFLWTHLKSEIDPEHDYSFILEDVLFLGKVLYSLNEKELVDFGLITNNLYYNLTILRLQRTNEDKTHDIHGLCDVCEIISEKFPLNNHQKEIFEKMNDLLDTMVEVDPEIVDKHFIDKTLLNHLAKTIQPIRFIKKSAMFSQKQIDQINSIGSEGFSHNLRIIVDSYFSQYKKQINIGRRNKEISIEIVKFSKESGIYKNITNTSDISEDDKNEFWDLIATNKAKILSILKDADTLRYNSDNKKRSEEDKIKIYLGNFKLIAEKQTRTVKEVWIWNSNVRSINRVYGLNII